MDISQVALELRKPMRRITLVPLPSAPGWRLRTVRALLALIPTANLDGVTIETRSSTGTDAARLRIYRPEVRRSAAALLWIHGGGLTIGRAVQNDWLCALTARELGILVASVEYRKAPDHPFPAALDDCLAGWRWLQREADHLEVDAARVAVGGQSAGGGLAASLVQNLCDARADAVIPAAQWLFCPMLDDRTAARHELDGVNHYVWNNRMNRFGWRSYLGVEPGASSVPDYAVAARRRDLGGLPPAWIGVGDIELFYDEDLSYAERLRSAGVDVTVEVVPGAPHGLEAWASGTAIARDYIDRAQTWLRQALRV